MIQYLLFLNENNEQINNAINNSMDNWQRTINCRTLRCAERLVETKDNVILT